MKSTFRRERTVFELIVRSSKEKAEETEVSLGLRLRVAGYETVCPVTRSCKNTDAFLIEIQAVLNNLEEIMKQSREVFRISGEQDKLGLKPDMSPQEIWHILSGIKEEGEFATSFNSLDETKRREVAEHVLTRCNIFAGKAAIFSSRYDEATALMD
jgi:hypothetical protein